MLNESYNICKLNETWLTNSLTSSVEAELILEWYQKWISAQNDTMNIIIIMTIIIIIIIFIIISCTMLAS